MSSLKDTKKTKPKYTKKLVLAALFAALSFVVAALSNVIPVSLVYIPAVNWLHYDAKDVIIALSGFILGPLWALGISFVVAILEMSISQTMVIGALMNFLSSAAFACTASTIYKYKKDIYGAVIGLISASFVTTAFMLGWNYLIVPLYPPFIPRESVAKLLLPGFLPFNLLKSFINSGFVLLVYKPIINALRSIKLVERKATTSGLKSLVISISAGAVLLLISALTVVLFNVL